jgi:hypothetical protein
MSTKSKPGYEGLFGDKRLEKRAEKITSMLLLGRNSSIHGISQTEAEQRACYRFLSNDKVEERLLIQGIGQRCREAVKGQEVLVIQDTTLLDFSKHRLSLMDADGVGAIGNHEGIGFLSHVSLAIDAGTGQLLGLPDIQLWHRSGPPSGRGNKGYRKMAIVNKESNKWLKACQTTKTLLTRSSRITFIEDREGDIYEQLATIPDERTHLLIRSRDNRRLMSGSKLYESIGVQPVAGSYKLTLNKDWRKNSTGQTVNLDVRFGQVEIARPAGSQNKHLPASVCLFGVDVRQRDQTKRGSIKWTLLTRRPITNYDQAIQVIETYKQRWYVEQFFRLLKQRGFRIEDSQLEDGLAIRKLLVMVMSAALRVLQMLLAYQSEDEQPISKVFTIEEQQCLTVINTKMQTPYWINPYPIHTIKYAVWIIARLAGWKPNNKNRPPGPTTLKNGLDKFISVFEGWQLAKNVS